MGQNQPNNRRSSSAVRFPLWAWGIIVTVGIIFVMGSAVWLFRSVRDMASQGGEAGDGFVASESAEVEQTPVVNSDGEVVVPPTLELLDDDEIRPWSGEDRITFMLLGVDQRCDEEGPTHTDSLMLVSIDPLTKSIAILSLPRDLWIEIPGFGLDRINQAYYFGEAYEYPGGGQAG